MKSSFFNLEARVNENTFRWVSRLLVAVMLACAAQTFVTLLGQIFSGWNPWYLSLAAFLIGLARLGSYSRLRKIDPLGVEWFQYFGAIWFIILVGLRVMVGLSRGWTAFLAELPRWPEDINAIFPADFALALVVALVVWFLADYFAELLAKFDLDFVRLQKEVPDLAEAALPPVRSRLLSLTLSIGIFLVILTAVMRIDLRAAGNAELVILQLPTLAGGGTSTLLYFMLGLALFSLTHFMDLQARWGLNDVPVGAGLAGRWAQYSLVFLAVLVLVVSLLPTSYSMGFLSGLGYALKLVLQVLFFIVQFVFAVFVFLVNSLSNLFRQEPILEEAPLPDFKPPEFFQAASAEPADPGLTPLWMESLQQLFFWVVLLAVVAFAVRQILLQNDELLAELRRVPIFGLLAGWWQHVRSFFARAGEGLREAVQAQAERLRVRRAAGQPARGWINLGRLDPRRKVYFYYQAFLRRSAESGLPRSRSQTPSEYAQRLDVALPESEPDIAALTAAFIEARYTRQQIAPQQASLAQRTWQRLRKALRKR
ncbi:MAG: DUF4129 domain-containing protein [Anaerolineales bacterium]|jgi:hypothetical protein|nr:DUF4129 domain-containing protein [Anaerolineales bacterium]